MGVHEVHALLEDFTELQLFAQWLVSDCLLFVEWAFFWLYWWKCWHVSLQSVLDEIDRPIDILATKVAGPFLVRSKIDIKVVPQQTINQVKILKLPKQMFVYFLLNHNLGLKDEFLHNFLVDRQTTQTFLVLVVTLIILISQRFLQVFLWADDLFDVFAELLCLFLAGVFVDIVEALLLGSYDFSLGFERFLIRKIKQVHNVDSIWVWRRRFCMRNIEPFSLNLKKRNLLVIACCWHDLQETPFFLLAFLQFLFLTTNWTKCASIGVDVISDLITTSNHRLHLM